MQGMGRAGLLAVESIENSISDLLDACDECSSLVDYFVTLITSLYSKGSVLVKAG